MYAPRARLEAVGEVHVIVGAVERAVLVRVALRKLVVQLVVHVVGDAVVVAGAEADADRARAQAVLAVEVHDGEATRLASCGGGSAAAITGGREAEVCGMACGDDGEFGTAPHPSVPPISSRL